MSRRDGLLLVFGVWGGIGYLMLLLEWPLIFGPILLAALFLASLYLALFVWPKNNGDD